MSHVAIAAVSMERCLQGNMPCEILFEIFRRLPKDKLFGISRLCSKFRDIADDTRLWKDVYIKHKPYEKPTQESFYFEELYCEPWPVKVLDLSKTLIFPRSWKPNTLQKSKRIDSQISGMIKINKLDLSSIRAPKITLEAILARYQCTELHLAYNGSYNNLMEIAPEVFAKQTALEMLSLRGFTFESDLQLWLASVLRYCKNLKTLDLNYNFWNAIKMDLSFIRSFPASLEKLSLAVIRLKNTFFELLAENTPNLRELELLDTTVARCPSLVEFQFLETLHIFLFGFLLQNLDLEDLCKHLIQFPALKTVYIGRHPSLTTTYQEINLEKCRTTLELHGIIVKPIEKPEKPKLENSWLVSKAM